MANSRDLRTRWGPLKLGPREWHRKYRLKERVLLGKCNVCSQPQEARWVNDRVSLIAISNSINKALCKIMKILLTFPALFCFSFGAGCFSFFFYRRNWDNDNAFLVGPAYRHRPFPLAPVPFLNFFLEYNIILSISSLRYVRRWYCTLYMPISAFRGYPSKKLSRCSEGLQWCPVSHCEVTDLKTKKNKRV